MEASFPSLITVGSNLRVLSKNPLKQMSCSTARHYQIQTWREHVPKSLGERVLPGTPHHAQEREWDPGRHWKSSSVTCPNPGMTKKLLNPEQYPDLCLETESQHHGIVQVGKDFQDHPVQPSQHCQGHPDPVPKCHVHMALKSLQEWGFHL